jgi:alpha-glucosidase
VSASGHSRLGSNQLQVRPAPVCRRNGRNAGFSTSEPWLPLSADFRRENVESQRADPASILNLYRRLIALRRSSRVLTAGTYRPLAAQGDLLLY